MILINTSRSSRGFSRIGTFLRCGQLYAFKEEARLNQLIQDYKKQQARASAAVTGTPFDDTAFETLEDPAGPEPDRAALIKGTLIGLGTGHWMAKLGAMQGGILLSASIAESGKYGDGMPATAQREATTLVTDPDVIMMPEEAMELWCQLNPAGEDFLGVAVNCVRAYTARYIEDAEKYRFFAVEVEQITELGKLSMEGHPEHGQPLLYTARLDFVTGVGSGDGARVFIHDTKTTGRVTSKQQVQYSLHGQFTGHRVLGAEAWGPRFGDALLNLVETTGETFSRPALDPSPGWTAAFKKRIFMAEHWRAFLELQTMKGELDVYEWPAVTHELGCVHRYGKCEAASKCMWGGA